MSVSPILPQPPPTGGTTANTNAGTLDPNAFLQLLVAQLEYQDPSNPTDPTQFMAESAQFTQVQSLNTLTTQSASALEATQNTTAAALLGKWIDATGSGATDVTGIVTGIRITTSGPQLEIGNVSTPLTNVKEVLASPPPSSSPTPSSTATTGGNSTGTTTGGSGNVPAAT